MVSKKEDDKESKEPEIYENENEGQLEEDHISKVKKKRNSDGGSWSPEACTSLGILHRLHSSLEKSLIERVIQYFKDRTESFDDYYPCTNNQKKKKNCNLQHVYNWIRLFLYLYNTKIRNTILFKIGSEMVLT